MCKYVTPEHAKIVFNTVVYYIGEASEGLGWPSRFKEVPTIHEVCPYHMTLYVNVPGWTLKSTFSLYSSGSEDPTVTDLLNRAK